MSTTYIRHGEVASLAEQLWEKAGKPDGRDLEFWLRAEQQVLAAIRDTKADLKGVPIQPTAPVAPAKSPRKTSALFQSRNKSPAR
jgi:hypothetical protein